MTVALYAHLPAAESLSVALAALEEHRYPACRS